MQSQESNQGEPQVSEEGEEINFSRPEGAPPPKHTAIATTETKEYPGEIMIMTVEIYEDGSRNASWHLMDRKAAIGLAQSLVKASLGIGEADFCHRTNYVHPAPGEGSAESSESRPKLFVVKS